jgi:hypothetical protein
MKNLSPVSFRRRDIDATPNFNSEHIPDDRYFVDTNEFSLEMIDRWQKLYNNLRPVKPQDTKEETKKPTLNNRVKLDQLNPIVVLNEETDEEIALAKSKLKK